MKRLKFAAAACGLLLAAAWFCGCGTVSDNDTDYTVRVLLPEGEGYTFLGSQLVEDGEGVGELIDSRILDVRPGQSVRFAVELGEWMVFDFEDENVSYADGYITVENVRTPVTVDATVRVGEKYVFSYNTNNKTDCVASTAVSNTFLLEKTDVTLSADVPEGQKFLGYSTGNFLDRGGKLICAETEYTFTIVEDTVLFANYEGYSHWELTYHANGGKGKDITDTVDDSFYYCPNTRPDKNYFTREGYILTGYNTKPDGSGDYYGLGWNVIMPESGKIDLYCVWEKAADASDFTYSVKGNNVTITGYSGNAEYLVIPEKIESSSVTAIAAKAFSDASFREVYIPKTVTSISSKAFNECRKLEKVNLSDSVTKCYDDSFFNCTAFKTLSPQATMYPHADSLINFTHQINYERLITRENDILYIVSGSTNIYGLSAARLEDALDNRWDIITYSTVASTPNALYAEIGLNFLDEDDILLFAPEASPAGHQWGTNFWKNIGWQLFEGAYDAIPLVDIRNYTKVFSSLASYNQTRAKTKEKTYEIFLTDFNEYGEHITYRKTGDVTNPWIKWDEATFFTDENVKNLNAVIDDANARGISTFIGWLACTTEHTLLAEAKDRNNQLHYMNRAAELYHADFFGDLADHIYPAHCVYDSAMHLTSEGCVLRTAQVIEDVTEAFLAAGLIKED